MSPKEVLFTKRVFWLAVACAVAWVRLGAALASASEGLPISPVAKGASPDAGLRPNFVFILTDDHRWDALGCAGHPFLKTPNLDRLANEGVRFANAFVTTSLCSPSRASFLTGQYAHTHGIRNNLTPWRDENITLLELLKAAGYETAFIGKWHMPGRGLPKLRGVDRFISFTAQAGQGQYYGCPLYVDGAWIERPGKYITEDLTDYALEFISRKRAAPFCLYLSHKAVHHQFVPPPQTRGIYSGEQLMLPAEADPWIPMMWGNMLAGGLGTLGYQYRRYCETLTALDIQIGRILARLDELGLTGNTVVVYASDNGFFWGEHRLFDKRWAYEEAIRIPFIVRYPARVRTPGRMENRMLLNVDLAPTLLDLAGLPRPTHLEGASFAPLLANQTCRWRGEWLYEYFKDFPYNVPEIRAVRTDRHIYIKYGGRLAPELFDLARDPRQQTNLIGTPEGEGLAAKLEPLLERLEKGGQPMQGGD